MDGYNRFCQHQKLFSEGKTEYYLFTLSIPEISMIYDLNVCTKNFKMVNGHEYHANLVGSVDNITLRIVSRTAMLKCVVSIVIDNKTLLLTKRVKTDPMYCKPNYYYELLELSPEDEIFQKLKRSPNNTLTFICKMRHSGYAGIVSVRAPGESPAGSLYNLRSLAAVLTDSSESFLKGKVALRVVEGTETGGETESLEATETVSKAILCARSPVFRTMFENDMRETKENVVNITDIKMPVLQVFISFLYTGTLPVCDFDMLCDLYYASDKYEVAGLRQICVDSIIPQISIENIHRVSKLAFSHNDEVLKPSVLAFIAIKIDTWFSTKDWKKLVDDEPTIAAEVLNFVHI